MQLVKSIMNISYIQILESILCEGPIDQVALYFNQSDQDKGWLVADDHPDEFIEWAAGGWSGTRLWMWVDSPESRKAILRSMREEGLSKGDLDEWLSLYDLQGYINDAEMEDLYSAFWQDKSEELRSLYSSPPAWMFMDFRKKMDNSWFVHFTDNALDIASQGFTHGAWDINDIATTHIQSSGGGGFFGGFNFEKPKGRLEGKEGGVWAVAYDAKDFKKYAHPDKWYGGKELGWRYGKECVIFKGDGIKLYHEQDEETQVIFHGPSVTSIYPCIQKDNVWALVRKDGTSIRESEDLEELVKWVMNA